MPRAIDLTQIVQPYAGAAAAAGLIAPYGGELKPLLVGAARAETLKQESRDWPSWDLSPRQVCDLELLLNGAFSPLEGYLSRADYERVCREMRLAGGTFWPLPLVLDVSERFAGGLAAEQQLTGAPKVALRDPEGMILAVLTVGEIWRPDRQREAREIFGTADGNDPRAQAFLEVTNPVYISGAIEGLELPQHHDFRFLRHTPAELRRQMSQLGWSRVIAFPTRHAMHRPQFELTLRAAHEQGAHLLIQPVVGLVQPGDADHFCRVRCYQALLPRYPEAPPMLSLLPGITRFAGPREVLLQAIVARNYGCNHLLIGQDDAVAPAFPGVVPFLPEVGVESITSKRLVYNSRRRSFQAADSVAPGESIIDYSSAEVRQMLRSGRGLPDWFTFPEIAAELLKTYPPRSRQGFTVFFTGLSGAGKSTIARALLDKLLEIGGRPVTMLDGDIVRKNLSSELGFSREHRDLNIRRIGFVANQITKNGGIAICAPIAPYDRIRREVRELVAGQGGFILVYAATPLEVCEQRDRKGLYARARAGILKEFTGISDPYEVPADADVTLNTAEVGVEAACNFVIQHLRKEGYLPAEAPL